MASFDNLVARKGSPTNSVRSGSTSAVSTSNVSETRDISRRSEQQARINHRRAIQVRKVAFLVLVLLLLVGGLSYAIYKVVSNESDKNESARLRLDEISYSKVAPQASVINTAKQSGTSGDSTGALYSTSVKHSIPSTQIKHQIPSISSLDLLSTAFDEGASTYYSVDKSTQNIASSAETMHHKESLNSRHGESSKIQASNTPSSHIIQTSISDATIPMATRSTSLGFSSSTSAGEHIETSTVKMKPEMRSTKDPNTLTTIISTGTGTLEASVLQVEPSSSIKQSVVEKEILVATSIVHGGPSTTRRSSTTMNIPTFSDNPSHSNYLSGYSMDLKSLTTEKTSTLSMRKHVSSLQAQPLVQTVSPSMTLNDSFIISNQSSARMEISHSIGPTSMSSSALKEKYQLSSTSTVFPTSINQSSSSVMKTSSAVMHSATMLNNSVTHSEMSKNILSTTVLLDAPMIVNSTSISSYGLINQSLHANLNSSLYSAQTATQIIPSKASSSPAPSSSVWLEPYYFAWANWGACSLKCGGGYKRRTRNCSQENSCGDLGPKVNETTCNMHQCNETTFQVYLNATDFQWTDDYRNKSSPAYNELVDSVTKQTISQYGPNITVVVHNVSRGSVIVSLTITFPETKTIQDIISAIEDGKLGNLSITLIQIINNMVPAEPSSVTVQNITTNSTVLRWNGVNEANGILLGYKILISPGNITLKIDNPEEITYHIINLIPETTYTIQLLGYNINGDGMERNITFKTKELPPHYLSWGEWTVCTRSCGGGITTRTRNCSKEGKCGHLGKPDEREHCNVFKCNETSYSVETNITNANWTDDLYNKSSKAYQDLLAEFIAELKKKYPNAKITGTLSKGSVVFSFTITSNGDSGNKETLKQDLEEDGLGNYTAKVNNIENNLLPKRPPGAINTTMITHHSAIVRWLPISEEDSNGAIIGYTILFYSSILNMTTKYNISVKASDTEFQHELRMLAPNTSYYFHMFGYNINGKGVVSDKIHFTTKVQIPMINSVNVSQITTRHAVLYWNRMPDNNMTYGTIMGYTILLFNHKEKHSIKVTSDKGSQALTNLSPNTTYNVTVLGYNEYGDGVVSNIFVFKTMVQIPMINLVNVSQVTTNHAVLHWNRIPDNSMTYGIIMWYKIRYFNHNENHSMEVSANNASVDLTNLSHNTTYNVTVLGLNEYGDGVISDIFTFKTMDLIPKPTSIHVFNITSNIAIAQWGGISSNAKSYGNIHGYKLIISIDNVTIMFLVTANITHLALRNLISNTTYNFKVLGYNEHGDGLVSDKYYFTTLVDEKEMATTSSSLTTPSVNLQHSTTAFSVGMSPSLSEKMSKMSSQVTNSSVYPSSVASWKYPQISSMKSMMSSQILTTSMTRLHQDLLHSSSSFLSSQFVDIHSTNTHVPTPSPLLAHSSGIPTTYSSHSEMASSSISLDIADKPSSMTPSPTISVTNQLSTIPAQTDNKYIVGQIRLLEVEWNSDLSNPESQTFKDMQTEMMAALTSLFQKKGIQLIRVYVYGFSAGSIAVDFFVTVAKISTYEPKHIILALQEVEKTGLNNKTFTIDDKNFRTRDVEPTVEPVSPNEAEKGLQKNNDDDDSALIIAIVMCVVLGIGATLVVFYIGKKRGWFNRSKRKVVPDDDDEDDLYPGPQTERMRLAKSARAPRSARGVRINGGHSTTEC